MSEEIKTISGDVIEIADKMIKGEIVGPVVTDSCLLINLRITGTGLTPRTLDGKEVIFNRPAGVFLSDKFLQMCNGLPVTWMHPEEGKFDYDNFKDYIIGTIVKPYVKSSTEVWGIAKIFDIEKLEKIYNDGIQSTSPFVVSKNINKSDGSIDEELLAVNHLAIVPNGHWDQIQKENPIKLGEIVFTDNMKVDSANKKELQLLKESEKVDSMTVEIAKGFSVEKVENGFTVKVNYEPEQLPNGETKYVDSKTLAFEDEKSLNDAIKNLLGGSSMTEEKKDNMTKIDEAEKEEKKDEASEEKKEDCSDKKDESEKEEKKDEAKEEEKKDEETPMTEKKDEEKKEEEKKDAEGEKSEVATLKAEIAELKANLAKIVAAEKGEGEKFSEMGAEHETLTADDDEKEQLIDAVSELADSAHAEIKIARPTPKRYENKFDYIRRTLSLNKDLVNEKFHCLMNKVDSSNFALAKDALDVLSKDVISKTHELNKKQKGAVVKIQTEDGAFTDVNYGRN